MLCILLQYSASFFGYTFLVIEQQPPLQILFSNGNLAHPRHIRSSTPAAIGQFAREAGFDGVEWTPIYWPVAMLGKAAAKDEIVVGSLHASVRAVWRTRGVNGTRHDRTVIDHLLSTPVGRLLMPEIVASAKFMGKVPDSIRAGLREEGRDRLVDAQPGVFYPLKDEKRDRRMRKRAACDVDLMQPTDHAARLLGARSIQHLTEILIGRGYGHNSKEPTEKDPYVLDFLHVRRQYGAREPGIVSNLAVSLPEIAAHSRAVHASYGRSDFRRETHIPTRQELDDALHDRPPRGQMADLFEAMRHNRLVYAVVETAAEDITNLTGHRKLGDLQKDFADLGAYTRRYLTV